MRKLGIIGGMSWVSTGMYYDRINRIVQKRAAPMASAPLLIESLDFAQLYALREERDWQRAADLQRLRAQGALAAGCHCDALSPNQPWFVIEYPMCARRHSIASARTASAPFAFSRRPPVSSARRIERHS